MTDETNNPIPKTFATNDKQKSPTTPAQTQTPLGMKWYHGLKILVICNLIVGILSMLSTFKYGELSLRTYYQLYPTYAIHDLCLGLSFLLIVSFLLLALIRRNPIALKLCLYWVAWNALQLVLYPVYLPSTYNLDFIVEVGFSVVLLLLTYFYLKKRLIPQENAKEDIPLIITEKFPEEMRTFLPLGIITFFFAATLITGILLIGHPEKFPPSFYEFGEQLSGSFLFD